MSTPVVETPPRSLDSGCWCVSHGCVRACARVVGVIGGAGGVVNATAHGYNGHNFSETVVSHATASLAMVLTGMVSF